MPCIGPTPAEEKAMEIATCKRLYGVSGTELDIATKVACHLAKGESNDLTRRWTAEHARRDAVREQQERNSYHERFIRQRVEQFEHTLRQETKRIK